MAGQDENVRLRHEGHGSGMVQWAGEFDAGEGVAPAEFLLERLFTGAGNDQAPARSLELLPGLEEFVDAFGRDDPAQEKDGTSPGCERPRGRKGGHIGAIGDEAQVQAGELRGQGGLGAPIDGDDDCGQPEGLGQQAPFPVTGGGQFWDAAEPEMVDRRHTQEPGQAHHGDITMDGELPGGGDVKGPASAGQVPGHPGEEADAVDAAEQPPAPAAQVVDLAPAGGGVHQFQVRLAGLAGVPGDDLGPPCDPTIGRGEGGHQTDPGGGQGTGDHERLFGGNMALDCCQASRDSRLRR